MSRQNVRSCVKTSHVLNLSLKRVIILDQMLAKSEHLQKKVLTALTSARRFVLIESFDDKRSEQVQREGNLLWKFVIHWGVVRSHGANGLWGCNPCRMDFRTQNDVFLIIFVFLPGLNVRADNVDWSEPNGWRWCGILLSLRLKNANGWNIRSKISIAQSYALLLTLVGNLSVRYAVRACVCVCHFSKSYFRVWTTQIKRTGK